MPRVIARLWANAMSTDAHPVVRHDSRAHRRVPFGGAARIDSSIARCRSISTGGVSVRSWSKLSPGEIVTLQIELPDGQIRTRAQVARVDGQQVGLRFMELDQRSLRAVLAYVAARHA